MRFQDLIEDKLYGTYNKYTYTKINGRLYNFSKGKYSTLKQDFINRLIFFEVEPLTRCVRCGDAYGQRNEATYICRVCGYKHKLGDQIVYWYDSNRYKIK